MGCIHINEKNTQTQTGDIYRERQTKCEKWRDKETDRMIIIKTQTVGDRNRQERTNSFTALLKKVCWNLKTSHKLLTINLGLECVNNIMLPILTQFLIGKAPLLYE